MEEDRSKEEGKDEGKGRVEEGVEDMVEEETEQVQVMGDEIGGAEKEPGCDESRGCGVPHKDNTEAELGGPVVIGVGRPLEERREGGQDVGDADSDPIYDAITQRTRDLSRSILNPKTLSTKIRESIIEIAGEEAASLYHVSGNYDASTSEWDFEVARLTPNFVAQLKVDGRGAEIGLAYRKEMESGWKIAVGVTAGRSWQVEDGVADLKGGFTVVVSR